MDRSSKKARFTEDGFTLNVGEATVRFVPVDQKSYNLVLNERYRRYDERPKFMRFDVYNDSQKPTDIPVGYMDVYFNGSGIYSFVDMQFLPTNEEYYAKSEFKSLPMPIDKAFQNLGEMLYIIAEYVANRHQENSMIFKSGLFLPEIKRYWEKLDEPLNSRISSCGISYVSKSF